MRRFFIILAAAFGLAKSAEGRIGDTEVEIRTRYGDAIAVLTSHTNDPSLVKCYSWQGYIASVTYVRGRSVREIFTKANNSHIAETEIQTALKANAGGLNWKAEEIVDPKSASTGVRAWRTSDEGSRVAFYDSQTRALFITTQRFIDLIKATNRQITMKQSVNTIAGSSATRRLREAGTHAARKMGMLDKGGALPSREGQSQPAASPGSK